MKFAQVFLIALAILVGASGTTSALSYSISAQTDSQSYVGTATVNVSGQVSPAPGPNTAVFIRVFNPSNNLVTADVVSVNGTTGLYSSSFAAGGSSAWVSGNYVINATWGGFGPVVFALAKFSWSGSAATTTTSVSSSTTSSSSSSSTSSTTETSITSTTSATGTHTSSSSISSTSISSSIATSRTSSSSSTSGVPEFPYSAAAVVLLTAAVAGAYLLMKERVGTKSRPSVESAA